MATDNKATTRTTSQPEKEPESFEHQRALSVGQKDRCVTIKKSWKRSTFSVCEQFRERRQREPLTSIWHLAYRLWQEPDVGAARRDLVDMFMRRRADLPELELATDS